jgi:hypothetical protein
MEELDEHASRRDAMVEEDASVHSWWRVLMLSSRLSLPTGSHFSLTMSREKGSHHHSQAGSQLAWL